MTISLSCHANCDDVFLAWKVDDTESQAIANCLGFAVEVRDASGKIEAIQNLKGFQQDTPKEGERRSSTEWPLQTYTWTNHAILIDSKVQFRVTAMTGSPDNLVRGESSAWSDVVTLTPHIDDKTSAFFNRGVILSQFVSRYAKENNLHTMQALKRNLTSVVNGPLMQFLTGELGKAIRGILQRAKTDPSIEIYCALFELDLDDLIEDFIAIGSRAHIVLANGSVKTKGEDENKAAASRLEGKVDLHRRMTAPKDLAHNKFVVVCENRVPTGTFTGSTNWTLTGFHTQINNGIAISDEKLAQFYLDQWHALAAAGSDFPPSLFDSNASSKGPVPLVGEQTARVWFTPIKSIRTSTGGPDISDLVSLVNGAKQGILFVMFMPGQEPLDTIIQCQKKGLYVRGVVSTLPMGRQDNPSATFKLLTGTDFKEYSQNIIEPQGVSAVGDFLSTFTRQEFLSGMGYAITHSKVIVIDPFGDHPVVVTGSHNLSANASRGNDENLLIIENNAALAQAYAVNCMSVYGHYRWPAYQHEASQQRSSGEDAGAGFLDTTDQWQAKAMRPDVLADLAFWCPDDSQRGADEPVRKIA